MELLSWTDLIMVKDWNGIQRNWWLGWLWGKMSLCEILYWEESPGQSKLGLQHTEWILRLGCSVLKVAQSYLKASYYCFRLSVFTTIGVAKVRVRELKEAGVLHPRNCQTRTRSSHQPRWGWAVLYILLSSQSFNLINPIPSKSGRTTTSRRGSLAT
jgi:hypothetical protein